MDVKEVIFSAIKELVLPEINVLKEKQDKLGERIKSVDQRLTDMNAHLLDQSRRIDSVRDELSGQITAVREELLGRNDGVRDELLGRIDGVRDELSGQISIVREELLGRIDGVREELSGRIDSLENKLSARIDAINARLDNLYEVIVRRDEHRELESRVTYCERKLAELESKLAA